MIPPDSPADWTALEDGLPPEHEQVLVTWDAVTGIAVAVFHDDRWFTSIGAGVDDEGDELATPTHWMPAPAGPLKRLDPRTD
jgi:hypothetical protein